MIFPGRGFPRADRRRLEAANSDADYDADLRELWNKRGRTDGWVSDRLARLGADTTALSIRLGRPTTFAV